ncbi:MAG: TonB-dependent receptor [Hymenobacteraceae bacterium]|nr:TonB-dependent receptor [Hymenobacteraceae bacterium]MDX5395859.1 TonB-dependent receptor [Hymenobacteraceae bacterium]MDX5511914.1 TonB-dependent receptor [Hymenobacteraceae bacterium]
MINIYRFLQLLLLLVVFLPAYAQQSSLKISGRVVEPVYQQPLPGVSIEATNGTATTTGPDGSFSIEIPAGNTLKFRLIGYNTIYFTPEGNIPDRTFVLWEKKLQLNEVVVKGYENNRPLSETPAAVAVANQEVLQRFNNTSLVPALNTLPGVRMEERAPASYRLSIRGSTLRSPYGVRNVKVYLNEIPYTDASGVTALNLLDVEMLERAEVLRGPAGSLYGAGTGGTVLLQLRQSEPGQISAGAGVLAGSYGLRRYHANAHSSDSNSTTMAQYTRQQYDGYRRHSAMDRHTLLASARFYPSSKQTITVQALYTDLFYQLPGGITREQYEQDPRQVRPLVETQQTAFNQEAANLGVSQLYRWNEHWSSRLALYGNFSSVDHPFVTDYERNTLYGLGGRSRTVFQTSLGKVAAKFTLGSEYQRGFLSARNYQNNSGTPDTLRFDDEIRTTTSLNFLQTEFETRNGWLFTAGASYNKLQYKINRVTDAATQKSYLLQREFDGVLSPRVAILKKLNSNTSVFASISQGYSPPTEAEVRTSDGSINQTLKPETGTNYEAGLRGSLFNNRFYYDVVAFHFRLQETIVTSTAATGVVIFENAGNTRQNGIETALQYYLVHEQAQWLSLVKLWSSYTYYHFRFNQYQKNQQDFSGNKLTGVAPHTLTAGLDLENRHGLYLYLTTNYSDEVPLNDANTIYANAFWTFGGKAGWRRNLGRKLKAEVFAGIDNATNTRYSLGNDLNAFGGRYFQVAPARNYFAGASFTFFIRRPYNF